MLVHLTIRDFAIVERLDVTLGPGLTVLTGETGAGKSILVDALNLALGGRSSAAAIRPGAPRTEITAVFDVRDLVDPAERLAALGLDIEEGECIVRRVVAAEGRSRAFVNGRPVPLQTLRTVTQGLVEVHGQHEHHSLLTRERQLALLDAFGGHETELEAVRAAARELRAVESERQRVLARADDREARLSYLGFQLRELEALAPVTDEIEPLLLEQRRLAHAHEIVSACHEIGDGLEGADDAGGPSLGASLERLRRLADLDPVLAAPAELLETALINVQEAAAALRAHGRSVEADPDRLAAVDARLGALHAAARQHRVAPEELPERLAALRAEVAALEATEQTLDALRRAGEAARAQYDTVAGRLSTRRSESGPLLARLVGERMRELGMPEGELLVAVAADPDRERPAAHGWDAVEFRVTTNPGHDPGPLAKVASGGELSRISLAIHVASAVRTGAPTLVFDEVDVGIGGGVAEQVGRRLREVAARKQVLCVTHLPQVAAQAHAHLRVLKRSDAGSTRAELVGISGEERVDEIARMLGGMTITEQTLAHAREMLEGALL